MLSRARSLVAGALSRVDPGWLFIVAGGVTLAATVLAPAHDDLAEARAMEARAEAIKAQRVARLERYSAFLDALERGDETLESHLLATQLNLGPVGRRAIIAPGDPALVDAGVFAALEPAVVAPREAGRPETLLRRMTTDRSVRLWVAVGGAVCLLAGLLPPARGRAGVARRSLAAADGRYARADEHS